MVKEVAMIQFLKRFTDHAFVIRLEGKEHLVGEGKPEFTVEFKKDIPVKELTDSTSLALGEAYMRGDLEIEGDLYEALDQFLGQMGRFSTNRFALQRLLHTSTSRKNQKKEVCSHYDLGNDFYSLWLDETMSYSCGYFRSPDDSLYQAQVQKVDYILEKLYLKPGMKLLDIGCGWGFLLIEAAKKYQVKGTGITLSREQHQKFQERIRAEGLEDYLTAELMDYRDLPKSGLIFDRVVSVGMVEHVGRPNYRQFVECVDQVMAPGGLFILHFISALKENDGDPWIRRYIFPGGTVPSLREMICQLSDLGFHTLDVENLRPHYNRTLLNWEKNFKEHRDEVREMFDEQFVRMWELYLCSCAASFNNGIVEIHQILASKGISREIPMVRWY